MVKRRQGEFVAGRRYPSRNRDLHLMAITHNILILYVNRGFLQSKTDTLFRLTVVDGGVLG